MVRINEMILSPLITLTFLCLRSLDVMSLVTATISVYRAWSQWIDYSDLRFQMQQMYLTTMATGGPQIVTNDPEYLPYVYADAVVRVRMRHPGSVPVRLRQAPWTSIRSTAPGHESLHP